MKAFAYFSAKNEPRIGISTDEGVFNFTYIWQIFTEIKGFRKAFELQFLQMMVEMDYFSLDTFKEVVSTVKEYRALDDLKIADAVRYDVPISRPQKILCLGRNYKKHAEEFGNVVPEEPIFFGKLPSTLLPHEGYIKIPTDIGRVDHEIELAVVIGKTGSHIGEGRAMDHVAGYTIANDVTAREMQKRHMSKQKPWMLSKGLDTFCPMGPYLVPRDQVYDPHNLNLELRVNGEVRQQSNTSNMVYKIPELISYISKFITLQSGDIICTGTPEGVSPIAAGDVVEGEAEGLGILRNRVTQE